MAMDLELAGRTALVTGASGGIGRGTALALAAGAVKGAIGARGREVPEVRGGENRAVHIFPHRLSGRFALWCRVCRFETHGFNAYRDRAACSSRTTCTNRADCTVAQNLFFAINVN